MRGPARLVLSLLPVALAACSSGDEARFAIERTEPDRLSIEHEPTDPIRVSFTRSVDEATVTGGNVFLWHPAGFVSAELGYDDATRTVSIVPREPLLPGSSYALVIRGDLQAIDGTRLGADFVQTFGTADRRVWGPTGTVAAGLDRIAQLSIDATGGYHLLAGEPSANGAWSYYGTTVDGRWRPPELLPYTAGAPVGFDLELDGSIRGAIAYGLPGTVVTRTAGTWGRPVDISLEPRPPLPPNAPWPDPLQYTWVAGGRVGSALRLGPRVGGLCRIVTATQDIPCPYDDATEEVWSAIVGPGNADFVLGAQVAEERHVWALEPATAIKDRIGPLGDGEVFWTASFGSSALGDVVAAYVTADGLPAGPGSGPFEVHVRAARFDPVVGWWPATGPVAVRTTPEATPFVESAVAPSGDLLVAWTLDSGDPARGRVLEVAHFVALSDPAGWSVIEFGEHVPSRAASFAAALDPSGHAWVAWVELELGTRRLWLRRFDPRAGWRDAELIVESSTDALGSVHLAAGIDGRVVLAWNERDAIVSRRFQ